MGLVSGLIIGASVLSAGGQIASGIGSRRAAADIEREGNRLANDALARGEEDVRRYGFDLSRLLGAQRTSIAAQGIDVNQGSAAQMRAQTEAFGEEDINTLRENAMREAFGLRRQASNTASQLRAQSIGQFAGAAGTLLNAGVNGWDVYNRGRGTATALPSGSRVMRPTNGMG